MSKQEAEEAEVEGEEKSVSTSNFGETIRLKEAAHEIFSLKLNRNFHNGLQGGEDGTREREEVWFKACSTFSPSLGPSPRPCSL